MTMYGVVIRFRGTYAVHMKYVLSEPLVWYPFRDILSFRQGIACLGECNTDFKNAGSYPHAIFLTHREDNS